MCVRHVCAVGVRPLVAPSLGIRANSGLSSGRCRARAPRGRVAGTYTGCTLVDATDGTRAGDGRRRVGLLGLRELVVAWPVVLGLGGGNGRGAWRGSSRYGGLIAYP